jgi:tetratricopeptide (TPR) repeat protein
MAGFLPGLKQIFTGSLIAGFLPDLNRIFTLNSLKRSLSVLYGTYLQRNMRNRFLSGKLLIIFMLILISSCSSRNNLRQRIDKFNSGNDKYLVAASIGEYAHLYPDDIKQLPLYAELLLQYGYFNECIELCNNILKKENKNWHVHYTRAIAYSNEWEFKNSINDFDTIFKLIKPDAEILAEYRAAILYSGIYQKILSLDSMIAENPANSELYLQRANLYLNMNEPGPAIADYDYCMDLSGFNEDIIYNKFRSEIMLDDYDQAKKDIDRIRSEGAKSGSLNPDLLSQIIDDAKKYEDMVQQNPGNITGYIEMARILTFLKIENKAVDYLKSAQKIQPDNEQIKYNLAIVYAMAGKKEQARELVKELESSGVNIPQQLKEMLK